MHCPACQGPVDPADRHCRHCGAVLAASTDASPAAAGMQAGKPRNRAAWWIAGLSLALLAGGWAWMAWHHAAVRHADAAGMPATFPGSRVAVAGDRPVDPVVAVSHAAVTLISIVDEYFDATGELPLSLADTGYTAADVHAGIRVDYERDTGRIHVVSPDGRYRFSAVLESPEEGDSWWVCTSDSLPAEEWPARCQAPQQQVVQPGVTEDDGADAAFPVSESNGSEASPTAPAATGAPARLP